MTSGKSAGSPGRPRARPRWPRYRSWLTAGSFAPAIASCSSTRPRQKSTCRLFAPRSMAAFDATRLISRFVLEHTSPAVPRRPTRRLLERIAHQGAKSRSLPPHHSPSAGGGVKYVRRGGGVEHVSRLYLTGGTTGPFGRPR